MKWDISHGGFQRSTHGTTKAYPYYYVARVGHGSYLAGRYWFNHEVDYGRITFTTPNQARKYCEQKDRDAVVLTSQS